MFRIRQVVPVILLSLVALAPAGMKADAPGRHPFYIHARSDLRAAQWMARGSEDPDVNRRLHQADEEIERAIHEIDRAAVLDRKDLEDHPHIDARLDRNGRFRRVMELLQKSRADIGREEDNPNAVGWRNLAYHHIDLAMDFVRRAARDLRIDRALGW